MAACADGCATPPPSGFLCFLLVAVSRILSGCGSSRELKCFARGHREALNQALGLNLPSAGAARILGQIDDHRIALAQKACVGYSVRDDYLGSPEKATSQPRTIAGCKQRVGGTSARSSTKQKLIYLKPENFPERHPGAHLICIRAVVVGIGINTLGYREVMGTAVGDIEAVGFWCQFLGSLSVRDLTGTRLVISDVHLLGLAASIKLTFQGCSWQR